MAQLDSKHQLPVVVIGDGWAATAAVGFLVTASEGAQRVHWIAGTGAKIGAPLPSIEAGMGAEACRELTIRLGLEASEAQPGSYLREFRNKAFREPAWSRAMEPAARMEILAECLQPCEAQLPPVQEVRFDRPFKEIDAMIRDRLFQGEDFSFERTEGVPVTGIRVESGRVTGVMLGSGQVVEASHVIFADRWSTIRELAGMPKGLTFLRRHEPVSVLQATFTHRHPMGIGLKEGFVSPLHREAGEESEKHLFGYFSSDGMRSHWSLCIPGEEAEDNHSIAKRLRRMKAALDKMFVGSEWLPAEAKDFMGTVESEHIRFEEQFLLSGDAPVTEPIRLTKLGGISFLTDGYGPAHAFHQAAVETGLFSRAADEPRTEREGVNLESTPTA